jgi:predicted TIM-barrel fold metal-dependent hydrolase
MFADGTADWFFDEAERIGMHMLVYAPGMQHLVAAKARQHPDLRITVCHLGISTALRDAEIEGPIQDVLRLSELPNIAVKASSLPSFVTDPYPFHSLHGHIRRVVDAFGPERVFWGSDLSRLSCDYAELKSLFTEELEFLDGEALELVMGRAISEWFGWPLPSVRVGHAGERA